MDEAASREEQVARLTAKRDNARWSAVVGFLLLFAASFSSALLIGGVGMITYGAVASLYWSRRLHRLKGDPWGYDPDLDGPAAPAWSREGKPAPPHDEEHQGHDEPQAGPAGNAQRNAEDGPERNPRRDREGQP